MFNEISMLKMKNNVGTLSSSPRHMALDQDGAFSNFVTISHACIRDTIDYAISVNSQIVIDDFATDKIIWKTFVIGAMLIRSHTIIEGATLTILGLFIYFWTITWEPFVILSKVACNISVVSTVLSQTCAEINFKSSIISYIPYVAIVIAIFGGILLVKGIIISSGKRRYMWGR